MQVSRAMVLTAPKQLELREFPVPEIGDEDGLLRVEACGICGTDYEQYVGDMTADRFRTPMGSVPGHEPVGRIVALGDGARRRWQVEVGDRVAVRPIFACGSCPACRRGATDDCRSRGGNYGFTPIDRAPALWGGYADYMYLEPLSTVVKVPDGICAAVATLVNPLACGISWAVEVPRTTPDDHVVVLGTGQRGLACVVAARRAGAASITVTGLERDRFKLDLAERLGADHTIEVSEDTDLQAQLREAVPDGVDVVVDTTPFDTQVLGDAAAVAAQRARIVSAGIKGRRAATALFQDDLTLKQLSIFGVSATTANDFRSAARLLADGDTDIAAMHSMSFGLDRAEEALLTAAGGREPVIHVAIEP